MLWLSSVKVSCWQKLRVNATVSILRGDYSPQGCDDITRVSIFGGDMGHWWWWWWWCVSTWGLPPTWRGTDSNKKDIWRHQVLDLGYFVDAVVSIIWNCRLVRAAITQTQGQGFISNDLIYLSPRIIYLPWWFHARATSSYTLTARKQSMKKQFPPTRSGCYIIWTHHS